MRSTAAGRSAVPGRLLPPRTFWGLLGFVGALALLPSAAQARHEPAAAHGGGTTAHRLSAEKLEEQGLEALKAQDLPTAWAKLCEAYVRAPSPQLLFHLGLVTAAQGQILEAQDYLRRFTGDPSVDEASESYKQAQELLARPRGASGEASVQGEPGALLRVDGRVVGVLPLTQPLLLSAKEHTLSLEWKQKVVSGPITILAGRGASVRFSFESDAILVSQPPAVVLVATLPLVPEGQRKAVMAAQQSVRRAGLAVYDTDAAIEQEPKLGGYLQKVEQQPGLTLSSKIEYVLSLGATATATGGCRLNITLRDPALPLPAATASESLPACAVEQLLPHLGTPLYNLLQQGSTRARGTLTVESEPAGAEVRSSGALLGKTPLALATWVGSHPLQLSSPQYETATATVEVTEQRQPAVPIVLRRRAEVEPPPAGVAGTSSGSAAPARRPRWRLATGVSAVTVGAVFTVLGGVALGVDGQCVPDANQAPTVLACRKLYDTVVPGAVTLGLSIAVLAGGVVLLALPSARAKR